MCLGFRRLNISRAAKIAFEDVVVLRAFVEVVSRTFLGFFLKVSNTRARRREDKENRKTLARGLRGGDGGKEGRERGERDSFSS